MSSNALERNCTLSLQSSVKKCLADSPQVKRMPIDVSVSDNSITLDGTVNTFHQKQMVQEVVRRVNGVDGRRILNNTTVVG